MFEKGLRRCKEAIPSVLTGVCWTVVITSLVLNSVTAYQNFKKDGEEE